MLFPHTLYGWDYTMYRLSLWQQLYAVQYQKGNTILLLTLGVHAQRGLATDLVWVSVCLCVCVSVCLCVCLSVCLSLLILALQDPNRLMSNIKNISSVSAQN